jgi:hypothetical protein
MSFCARAMCVLAGVAAVLGAGEAFAKERPRVAVLDLAIAGDAPPELRVELERSLAGGLSSLGFEVLSREDTLRRLKETPELLGCSTTTCLARIGALVGASRFVRGRVEAEGAAFDIELELLSADVSGGVIARVERSCAVCTLAEANDTMSSAALALTEQSVAKARLTIRTLPPGGSVRVDGSPVGTAPAEVELGPGPHEIRAELEGYLPGGKRVDLQPGQTHEMTVPLLAPIPAKGSRFGMWKWIAGGAAGGALAVGLTLMVLDGNCTDTPPSGQECKDLHDTLWGGVSLAAAGAALGGATAYMVLHDQPRLPPTTERQISILPSRDGVKASLRLEF